MHWRVEGAEARTGVERSYTVEAATAGEAEQWARELGLLVSSVKAAAPPRSTAETLDKLLATPDGSGRGDARSPRSSAHPPGARYDPPFAPPGRSAGPALSRPASAGPASSGPTPAQVNTPAPVRPPAILPESAPPTAAAASAPSSRPAAVVAPPPVAATPAIPRAVAGVAVTPPIPVYPPEAARAEPVPPPPPPPRAAASEPPPEYEGIVRGATLLQRGARIYTTLAVLAFLLAGVALLGGVIVAARDANPRAMIEPAVVGVAAALAGALLLSAGTCHRLLASLSLALRDLARNSFRS